MQDAKAYSYILDSLEHYPAQKGVDQLLRKTGFFLKRLDSFVGGTMCLSYATKPLKLHKFYDNRLVYLANII